MKIRPICKDCEREIKDDLCLVMDKDDAFDSCICLSCRDKAEQMLRRFPHIQGAAFEQLDAFLDTVPMRQVDVISTSFARLLA